MLRHLRVSVTVLCLTACVLLIAIWVRRFFAQDMITGPLSANTSLGISARPEGLGIFHQQIKVPEWNLISLRPDMPNIKPYAGVLGFGLCKAAGELSGIVLPYWFLIVASGATATALIVKAPSRQFSMRTMLFATTLVAVVLGFIAAVLL